VTLANRHFRAARLYGVSFAALFTLALTALLGQLFGAFADSAEPFTPYFDTTLERLQHGLGAYLLVASGLAFLGFAVCATAGLVEPRIPKSRWQASQPLSSPAWSVLLLRRWRRFSLSIGFGQIAGDPGIRDGEELLPQLGYVVLAVPAAVSAAFSIWLLARLGSQTARWPRWVTTAGYVVAVLQLFSFYSLPLFLLPLWVLAASISFRESPAI
jgi:hypothetical protein